MRLPTTKLKLPNDFNKLKFPVNRIGDNTTFNNRVQLLEENFQKLLEFSSVVDNNLPLEDIKLNIATGHTYNHIETVKRYDDKIILIGAKQDEIDFYSIDNNGNNYTPIKTYDQIKDTGNLKFKNISYIKYNESRLYVYDDVYDSIFVYDINTFINNDTATTNIKFLKQFFKIRNLIAFDFNDNNIIGVKGDGTIVCYNRDFNVKTSALLSDTPIDMQVNSGGVYILYDNKIEIYNINLIKEGEFSYFKIFGGETLRLLFSKHDLDVFYLLTSSTVYKYKSDGVLIGYFKGVIGRTLLDVSIYDNQTDDLIFTLDITDIQLFKDKIVEYKLYDETNLRDAESVENLQINNLEVEQDFVYNAVIQKMIFNTFLLYNSLLFKAFIETDENGVLVFKYLENLQNSDTLNKNLVFYGQNEVFSYQTFNRAFKEIYDIQIKILNLLEFNIVESSTNTLII